MANPNSQIGGYGQGVWNNYTPQSRHLGGIKFNPYALNYHGVLFASGQTLAPGQGDGPTPARFGMPTVMNIPKCCGGCY